MTRKAAPKYRKVRYLVNRSGTRKSVKAKHVRSEDFEDLDGDTQEDVVRGITALTGEYEEDVRERLDLGARLNIVLANPKILMEKTPGYPVNSEVYAEYLDAWLSGANFPPVIIDSSKKDDPLIEGGHRTASAADANVGMIQAVDLAGLRVVERNGVNVYDFPR